uniref:Uncharacterized protein n=1 Tax=Arundo donax TaxID=35708 RepID=A0A0A9HPP2_ARUDO
MEIKDAVLPPWVVSGICSAMSSDSSFDLTIATEPSSMGLNIALSSMSTNAQPEAVPPSDGCASLGIPDAVLVPPCAPPRCGASATRRASTSRTRLCELELRLPEA